MHLTTLLRMLPSLNEITFKLFSQAKVKRLGKLVFKLEPESDTGPIWTKPKH